MGKRSKGRTIMAVVVLAVGILLFEALSQEAVGVKDVYAKAAKDLTAKTTDLQIVDVREPDEYAQGHIAGSRLIPLGQLTDRLDELDRGKPVLLVCRSGNRSSQAAKLLMESGFDQVYNLAGGMLEWPYEVER